MATTAATAPARPARTMKVVVIAAVAGGCLLLLLAVGGIVAALVIPNFIDAMQKAKAHRTIADLRTLATSLEGYREQSGSYPAAASAAEVGPMLAAHGYQGKMEDGWQRSLRYTCLSQAEGGCASYELASAGRDGAFEHEPGGYQEESFAPTAYDTDIVLGDGMFNRWPEGQGRSPSGG